MLCIPEDDDPNAEEDEYVEFENEEEGHEQTMEVEEVVEKMEEDAVAEEEVVQEETEEVVQEETTETTTEEKTEVEPGSAIPGQRIIPENLTLEEEIQSHKKNNKRGNKRNNNSNSGGGNKNKRKKKSKPMKKTADPNVVRKLFVGNVPHSIEEKVFKEYWSQFGELKDSVLIPKQGKPNGHRGFGFVKFEDYAINKSVLDQEHKIGGKVVNVKASEPITEKYFVGGVTKTTTLEEFDEYFGKYGDIIEIFMLPDRGFGFVTLVKEGKNLHPLNDKKHHQINGKKCEVRLASPKSDPLFGGKGNNKRKKGKSSYITTNNRRPRGVSMAPPQYMSYPTGGRPMGSGYAPGGPRPGGYGARFSPYGAPPGPPMATVTSQYRTWDPAAQQRFAYSQQRRRGMGSGYPAQMWRRPAVPGSAPFRGGHSNVW